MPQLGREEILRFMRLLRDCRALAAKDGLDTSAIDNAMAKLQPAFDEPEKATDCALSAADECLRR